MGPTPLCKPSQNRKYISSDDFQELQPLRHYDGGVLFWALEFVAQPCTAVD